MTDTIQKRYYKIGEVAEILKESKGCIRFWTQKAGIRPLVIGGRSRFIKKDLDLLRSLQEFIRVKRYSIAGAVEMLSSKRESECIEQEWENMLKFGLD